MRSHVRANLWLLLLTVLLCCAVYPLLLLAAGQSLFRDRARGSLVTDPDGTVRGSRLIAQPFTDDKYFWPRPSAVGYNAAASGGSNYAANNPLLRDRVARQLGPLVRYAEGPKEGRRAGPDVEAWFGANPGLLGRWAGKNPTLAARWVKDDPNHEAAGRWLKDHPGVVRAWQKKNPDAPAPDLDRVKDLPDDLTVAVLTSFAAADGNAWPIPRQRQGRDGKPQKYLAAERPDSAGKKEITDLQAVLFDAWLRAHPGLGGRLRKVPADMVMASGSGLDPHITLANARYQLDRVADNWAGATRRDRDEVRQEIEAQLEARAAAPLGGLAGVKLVNVLEVNLWLRQRYASPEPSSSRRASP
jgi:K+-transporting ATPase ATPase C chain